MLSTPMGGGGRPEMDKCGRGGGCLVWTSTLKFINKLFLNHEISKL